MTLKIKSNNKLNYPPVIKDLLKRLCKQKKPFTELTVWYNDGYFHTFYDAEDSIIDFQEEYLVEESNTGSLVYILYKDIYELNIRPPDKEN